MQKILVFAVHPDDETLGCGGTIFKHLYDGDQVYCAFITNGNSFQSTLIPKLSEHYGFTDIEVLGFDEIYLDDLSLNDLISPISQIISKYKPDILYIPNRSDAHSDHRKSFEAIMVCTKSFRYPFIKKILMCEVISETDFAPAIYDRTFLPNFFVDITEFWEKKREAIKLFEPELLSDPYTRSLSAIEALHRYRGSQISVMYAESFMLIKEVYQ